MPETIYEIGGVEYEFPDDMSPDQVRDVLISQGIIEAPVVEAPVVPDLPERAVAFTVPERQAEQVEERAQRLGMEMALQKAAVDQPDFRAVLEREVARARRDIERERARPFVSGREEPEVVEREGLPFFRPTQIVEEPLVGVLPTGEQLTARLIRDPETGEMRTPTATEEAREAFARQTIMGEEEARRLAAEGVADPMGILARREAGEGIVETATGAALRSFLSWASAGLGEAYFSGLGYEVDEQGVPVNPDDFGLAVAQAREALGIPAVIPVQEVMEKIPIPGADVPVQAAFAELGRLYPAFAGGIPAPGVATTRQTRKAYDLDPTGIRQASDVEMPPITSPLEWLEAGTKRISQNVAAGRSLGDEFQDAPEVRAYYEELWGDPNAAYFAGLIPELFTPAGPGVAAKTAARLSAAGGKAAIKAADAGYRAANAAAEALAKADPEGLAFTSLRLKGMGLEMMDNPATEALAATRAFAKPGKNTDVAVTKKVARAVVEANRDLSPTQRADALKAIDGLTEPGEGNAMAAINRALTKDIPPSRPQTPSPERVAAARNVKIMAEQMRLNMPGDYVQVTETVAVPRNVPGYKDFPKTVRQASSRAAQRAVERQPDSKARTLRFAADGNLGVLGLGNVAVSPKQAARLNRIAEQLDNAALRVDDVSAPIRTPKLDKQAMAAIRDIVPDIGTRPDDLRAIEANFRSRRVSEITAGYSSAERAAIEEATFFKVSGVPDEAAGRVMPAPLQSSFDELPIEAKRILVETIKKKWLEANVGPMARSTSDLTALQMYVRDVNRSMGDILRWATTPEARKFAVLLPGFRVQSRKIANVQQAAKLRRLGREAAGVVQKRLIGTAKDIARNGGKASVDEALDSVLSQGIFDVVSTELGFPATTQQSALGHYERRSEIAQDLWRMAVQKMYPEANQEDLLVLLKERPDYLTGPTVQGLMEFDKIVKNSPGIEKTGWFRTAGRDWAAPEFQKIMLDLIIDQTMRPLLARESLRFRSLIEEDILLAQQAAKNKGVGVEALLADPNRAEALVEAAANNVFHVPTPGKVSIPTYGRDTAIERPLAEGGVEFVELLEAVAPKHRRTLLEIVQDAASYLAGPFRRNAIQAAKYGYVLPNIPFLMYKGMEVPFKAAAMVGINDAAAGAQRILAKLAKRQEFGGGIVTPDGIRYSGPDLLRLAEQEGIGYAALTGNRVGTLAQDILDEVARQTGVKGKVLAELSPVRKNIYIRSAEALERSVRQGVFEARLLAGDSVAEAAKRARASQFDFDKTPDVIRQQIARVFQGAAEGYTLTTELIKKGLQSPKALTAGLKALEENRQRQDPYGLAGDQALANLILAGGDEPDSPSYYVPIPGSRTLTKAVSAAAFANNAVTDLRKFFNRNQSIYDTVVEVGMESGGPVLWSSGDALLPGVLDSFEAFDPITPAAEAGDVPREVSTEKMMWAHALWAANMDPMREPGGPWEGFMELWEPIMEPPPPNRAVPGMPNYWRTVPPGMPYILRGRAGDGTPLYMTIQPSKRGEFRANVIRGLTPDAVERAMVVAGTYGLDGLSMFAEEQEGVHAKGVIKANPLMDLAFNPTGVNFNDPEGVQKALAEKVLVEREVTE